jgi:acetyl esterase/lipase
VDLSDTVCRQYVHMSGATLASVAYRLAPENPYPAGIEDAYAALLYLADHASQLGGSPSRLAVMGESSGGGMAAGLALMVRDRGGPSLVSQVLIYPMLDDRSVVPDAEIARFLTWTYEDNATGWMTLLGDAYGTDDVPVYAAPARASALSDLPAAFVDVGELDAFRDEDVAYALRLVRAGVPIELHVRPGAPHAFETIAPDAAITRRAVADRIRVLSGV